MMLDDLDLDELRRVRRVSYYFRYPLHRRDFHEFRVRGGVRGHYAAKPLYGRLTSEGRVDRSAGYNGDVAALFVPVEAVAVEDASVVLAHVDPRRVASATGRKNWPVIRAAAERGLREMLGVPPESVPNRLLLPGRRGEGDT
jgi:hypothetical protein